MTLAREQARAVWYAPWLESVWQDVAVRRAQPAPQPDHDLVDHGRREIFKIEA